MSEWETVGFRVSWLRSPAFASHPPSVESMTVTTAAEALAAVREVVRRKPVTERGTYRPQVVELQQRIEAREVPCGLAGWGN